MKLTLNSIKISDFKCFGIEQDLDFSNITIITGINSSGKSSLLYSILGGLQSMNFPFLFSPNGKYVNMGDFKEMVTNHDTKKKIKLEYNFIDENQIEYSIVSQWEEHKTNKQPVLSTLIVNTSYFSFRLSKKEKYLLSFHYDPTKDKEATELKKSNFQNILKGIFSTISEVRNDKSKKNGPNKMKSAAFDYERYAESYFAPFSCENVELESLENIGQEKPVLNSRVSTTYNLIRKIFKEFDQSFNFVSSFRLHPDRTYLEKYDTDKIKKFGEGYLDQLIRWEDSKNKRFLEVVNEMRRLDLLDSIETNRLGGGRFEILIKNKNNKIKTPLTDVGFGISQFLPIIIADTQLPTYSTMFIAQPEIHLHPSAQAAFGDYIFSNSQKGKKYVIETHSEYLINRLRVKIAKGEMESKDLKLYYIENFKNIPKVHKLILKKDGSIDNAPKSFFDTYFLDVKDIALNSFE